MEPKPRFSPQSRLLALMHMKNASWAHFLLQLPAKPTYWLIIFSNLAIFFLPGLDLAHNAATFLYIYIFNSLLIGIAHVIKLNFYHFARPDRPTDWKNPHAISLFFIFHYGFFHLVYVFFIPPKNLNWDTIWIGTAINGAMIILNSIRHFAKENSGNYNANDFMFLPYARVFPIHIAIILGGFVGAVVGNYLAVFVILAILKTLMELGLEYMQSLGFSFAEIKKINESSEPN